MNTVIQPVGDLENSFGIFFTYIFLKSTHRQSQEKLLISGGNG